MKYRLTVKGQVALTTVMLVVVFGAGTLWGAIQSQIAEAISLPASTEQVQSEPPEASAPCEAPSGNSSGPAEASSGDAVHSHEQLNAISATVYFSPDQWELQAEEIRKITSMVEPLRACPDLKIVVESHINGSPGVQDSPFGKDLSLKRGDVVAQALIGQGIDQSRITMISKGSSEPVTSDQNQLWQNRRTQIYIVGFNGESP